MLWKLNAFLTSMYVVFLTGCTSPEMRDPAEPKDTCYFEASIDQEQFNLNFDYWINSVDEANEIYYDRFGQLTFNFNEKYYFIDYCESGRQLNWVSNEIEEYVSVTSIDRDDFISRVNNANSR